jgi:hypothetical protein
MERVEYARAAAAVIRVHQALRFGEDPELLWQGSCSSRFDHAAVPADTHDVPQAARASTPSFSDIRFAPLATRCGMPSVVLPQARINRTMALPICTCVDIKILDPTCPFRRRRKAHSPSPPPD